MRRFTKLAVAAAFALAFVCTLSTPAHAQMSEPEMWEAYDMLLAMDSAGVDDSIEGGRMAAIVAESFNYEMETDPWGWDLDQPYQGFSCAEKEQKVSDLNRLIFTLDILSAVYGAGALAAGGLGAVPVAAAFSFGVATLQTSRAGANALRMQVIGTTCNPG